MAITTATNHRTVATTSATTLTAPTYATARGMIIGDTGTSIEVFMETQSGLNPLGYGGGLDNKGARYPIRLFIKPFDCNASQFKWGDQRDLNPRPPDSQSGALTN